MNTRFASATSLVLCGLLVAATARADAFIRIDGIPGESTDRTHKDEIAIDSYSLGASSSASVTSGGASAGKVQFDALTFSHKVDRASAPLLLASARGQRIKTVVLTVRKRAGTNDYLKITLTDVLVSSVKIAGTDSEVPTEEVALRFGKIAYEYLPTQPDGKPGDAVKVGWDLASNKAL